MCRRSAIDQSFSELRELTHLHWHGNAQIIGDFDATLMRQPNTEIVVGVAQSLPGGAVVYLLPALCEPRDAETLLEERMEERASQLKRLFEFLADLTFVDEPDPPPDWTKSLLLVGEQDLADRASALRLEVDRVQQEITDVTGQLDELGHWKALVFATGDQFQDAVERAFTLLGFHSPRGDAKPY